jgi:integrase
LRVSYATSLARAGVPLAQAQRLMRHSDPKLTANVYTRLELSDARAAVAKIDVAPAGEANAASAS